MELQVNNKILAKAVAICIAMGSLPAFAQDFDPPGSHTWSLDKGVNPGVHTSGGRQTVLNGTVSNYLYGEDWLIGAKPTIVWHKDANGNVIKEGFIPLAVSAASYGTGCTVSSPCSTQTSVTTSSCVIKQTTWGLTSSTDFFAVNLISLSYSSLNETRQCSGNNQTASKTVTRYLNGSKQYSVIGTGYKLASATSQSDLVYWSRTVRAIGNTDQAGWEKVADVCVALGWVKPAGGRTWEAIRDTVKGNGFCRLSNGRRVKGRAIGPQPFERIQAHPIVSSGTVINIGGYYSNKNW
jgi:hypothetical protein